MSNVERASRAAIAIGLALCLLAARAAAAQEATPAAAPPPAVEPLHWNDDWPRFRPIGYALTGASVAGALAVTLLVTYPDAPRWSGPILFDQPVRDALRARDPHVRDGIRLASDFTLAATLINAVLIDGLAVPLAEHAPEVAWQLSLMNAQALSLNILVATLLFKAVARTRPPAADCARDPNFDPLCDTGSYASFPSSHTSTAFTAAGLTCVHHKYLPLYGGGVWDQTACVAALTLATATGLFRIVGDRHYATDVIMGAALGLGFGYLYPWLFHYGAHNAPDKPQRGENADLNWGLVPAGASTPYSLAVAGQF
jgi:membrane-associated phospholipid phosphatase